MTSLSLYSEGSLVLHILSTVKHCRQIVLPREQQIYKYVSKPWHRHCRLDCVKGRKYPTIDNDVDSMAVSLPQIICYEISDIVALRLFIIISAFSRFVFIIIAVLVRCLFVSIDRLVKKPLWGWWLWRVGVRVLPLWIKMMLFLWTVSSIDFGKILMTLIFHSCAFYCYFCGSDW